MKSDRGSGNRDVEPKRQGGAFAAAALTAALISLFLVTTASASYEQVGVWGDGVGNTELAGTRSVAVNASGAGGVPAGSIYVVGRGLGGSGVFRYGPKGEFLGHWGAFQGEGIAIDQSTGNVYVMENRNSGDEIEVYNATGSELITSFGEKAGPGETVNESPAKIHNDGIASTIAVNGSGTVYLEDRVVGEDRIMVFEPLNPGDFSTYIYVGRERDIAVGKGGGQLAIDAVGNLYLAAEFQVAIEEYDPDLPAAPICRYETPSRKGGILGMTVNAETGEVVYFSQKDKKFHELSSCVEGKSTEIGSFEATPKPEQIEALTIDPSRQWQESRPAGVLYAVDEAFHAGHGQGYIFAPPEVHLPVVESETVNSVTDSTATLVAKVNPKGTVTRYHFQYLTDAAYQANEPSDRFKGATEAPGGGAALGSGQEGLIASSTVLGLAPDTEYRYRVIASNCAIGEEGETCEATGPTQTFHTFPSGPSELPDHRAYELVSPAQKSGGEVFPLDPTTYSCAKECKPGSRASEWFPIQPSPDGKAIAYEGFSFSATEGAAVLNEYLSTRGGSGWQTANPTPPLFVADEDSGYKAFDPDLSAGLLYQIRPPTLAPDAPPGYANLYSQSSAEPAALSALMTSAPPNRPEGVVGPPLGFHIAYAGASRDLSRVLFAANDALTPADPGIAPAAVDGGDNRNNLYVSVAGQLHLVNIQPGNTETFPGASVAGPHVISADGSRIFWSSAAGQAYVRLNGEKTEEVPDHTGGFLTASSDGSRLLLDDGNLFDVTDLANAPIDLTQGEGGFKGIAGQSEDLSSIYFVDTAALTSEGEVNSHGDHAVENLNNLYYWHEGAVTFVATLAAPDSGAWATSPVQRAAESSPNGRWIAFLSQAPITGFDNTGPCALNASQEAVDGPCPEAFLFDALSEELVCASCDPSGERPLGPTHLPIIGKARGFTPQQQYLLDDGRLFFDTRDSLSPFDTNNGVEDVYEYAPSGIETCTRKANCVSLISAGTEAVDSNFLAVDPAGLNVFFTSRDRLVPSDHDGLIDLYTAREFGGITSEPKPEDCPGEAFCPSPGPQSEPVPNSAAPQEGNPPTPKPKPCPKGKVRKSGRCVKKKAKHHKKARHHKRAASKSRGAGK